MAQYKISEEVGHWFTSSTWRVGVDGAEKFLEIPGAKQVLDTIHLPPGTVVGDGEGEWFQNTPRDIVREWVVRGILIPVPEANPKEEQTIKIETIQE